jgi:hypothetical protein
MNNIQKKIEEIFLSNEYDIKSVGYGHKHKNGIETDELSIVFSVYNKKPLSELSDSKIIPTYINVDGVDIKTDVIENKTNLVFLGCYAENDAEILKLRSNPQLLSPIKGGQEIVQFPTNWELQQDNTYKINTGTLGFFAIDNEDGKVVGVTNNHVACYDKRQNADRNNNIYSNNNPAYNLFQPIKLQGTDSFFSPSVLVRESPTVISANSPFNTMKRYLPFKVGGVVNYVDVALLSLKNSVVFTNDSRKFHQPDSTINLNSNNGEYFPFATTSEINNLLISDPTVYSVGKTTGPKGWGNSDSCKLKIVSSFESSDISYVHEGVSYIVKFSDFITYSHRDNSDGAIGEGDSGSALLAEIDGTVKIIGLVFAGYIQEGQNTGDTGVACRIDRVADEINIRSWNNDDTLNFNTNLNLYARPYNYDNLSENNEKFITLNSKKYYNIGLSGISTLS